MYLSKEDEAILAGEKGQSSRKAMELLVVLGNIFEAEELIPVSSAQLAGVSYKTMGDAGLQFIQRFADSAEVTIPTTLNPAGMDLENWREMGIPESFASKQIELIEAYAKMGVATTCTCTPYFVGNRPSLGDHIAWSESSAVSFANSALGARTNREGGVSALAASIIGKTPAYGFHLDEGRKATKVVDVSADMSVFDYSILGAHIGKLLKDSVPYFRGISPSEDEMKSLGAAMAATGAVAMYHVEGVTPEWQINDADGLDVISVERKDLQEIKENMSENVVPELVAIGCPHCSKDELRRIAEFLDGKKKVPGTKLWVFTSRKVGEGSGEYLAVINRYGRVVFDTCMVVSPIEGIINSTSTPSGKAATYLKMEKFGGQRVVFESIEDALGRLVE